MKTRSVALTTVVTVVTLAGAAVPAHAATTGVLTAPGPGVLYDDCRDVAVPYSFDIPTGTDYYSVDLDTIAPDGTHGPSDSVDSFRSDMPGGYVTGSAQLEFCGYELPGTYTVTATGEYSDYDNDVQDAPIAFNSVAFTMRQPQTETALQARAAKRNTRLTVRVSDERPAGYFATEDASVRIEMLEGSHWKTLKHAKGLTDTHGRWVLSIPRTGKKAKVRAVTNGSSHYTGSQSRTLTVH